MAQQEFFWDLGNILGLAAKSDGGDAGNTSTPEFKKSAKRTVILKKPKSNPTTKKKKDSAEWVDYKAKQARTLGIAGIGRKGKSIPARTMGPGCSNGATSPECRFKCHTRVMEHDRMEAFKLFWNLDSFVAKTACLLSWVTKSNISAKSQRKNNSSIGNSGSSDESESEKKKTCIFRYTLPTDDGLKNVCKTMFLSTLAINRSRIDLAFQKQEKSLIKVIVEGDKRGKHQNRPYKYTEEMKEIVKQHILSFPTTEPCNGNDPSKKKYLQEGLSVAQMYRLYKTNLDERNIKDHVSESEYRKIFQYEFNIGFSNPKKKVVQSKVSQPRQEVSSEPGIPSEGFFKGQGVVAYGEITAAELLSDVLNKANPGVEGNVPSVGEASRHFNQLRRFVESRSNVTEDILQSLHLLDSFISSEKLKYKN